MNSFFNNLDLEGAKSKIDEVIKTISSVDNPDISSMGKRLDAGIKDAFDKNDLTKLQKLLNDVNKNN